MFGLLIILVFCEASAYENVYSQAPPYVQSRAAFTRARSYLQENVPFERRNITSPEARIHLAFGILVEVTRIMVRDYMRQFDNNIVYDPLKIVQEITPRAWEEYNTISNSMQELLEEAQYKIDIITFKMDTICKRIVSIEICNYLVHQRVQKSNDIIKNEAELLLTIGQVSKALMKHKEELDHVARSFTVVPYLISHVETGGYQNFVTDLANVYYLMESEVSID